ncbi:MAG: VOC family protein [Bacteroidales bacterium]|jgi:predicted 3-demethylubiquinone-9 3-methyltransferase (glyoxalase superfamily)|nr:VOC family protein [Bacteroidales bacterium]
MNNSIYPSVWFNNNAREAAEFYLSVFPKAKIADENPVVVIMEVSGQKLMLLNGGDMFRPNPSISLMYLTSSQSEVEEIYSQLIEDGKSLMQLDKYPFSPKYGWVEDRYGVSWQLYCGQEEHIIQKLVPTLMFSGRNNGKAEEAVGFYSSVLPDSKPRGMLRYTGAEGEVAGNIQHGEFMIRDYLLMIMDSSLSDDFSFTEGVSLVVECDTQAEIDKYWTALTSAGGEESMCGWLKDRYGVSWQIVPTVLPALMAMSRRVTEELLKMKKLDIRKLTEAAG